MLYPYRIECDSAHVLVYDDEDYSIELVRLRDLLKLYNYHSVVDRYVSDYGVSFELDKWGRIVKDEVLIKAGKGICSKYGEVFKNKSGCYQLWRITNRLYVLPASSCDFPNMYEKFLSFNGIRIYLDALKDQKCIYSLNNFEYKDDILRLLKSQNNTSKNLKNAMKYMNSELKRRACLLL